MTVITIFKEAMRIFARRLSVEKEGVKKYEGNDEKICKQIIKECFNGEYFQVSTGHFNEFYIRDFALCIEALYNLGYKEEVRKTLKFCLGIYSKNKKITTTITPNKKPIDIFFYSPDSLPLLLYSIRISKNYDLLEVYRQFINSEIMKYFNIVLDIQHGYVKSKVQFSSIRDHVPRQSSCYNNCFLAMLKDEIESANRRKELLSNPFKGYNFKEKIKKYFWVGYFKEDLYSYEITGDSQIFPFWCNLFDDKTMIEKTIQTIRTEKLDLPFPLKYSQEEEEKHFLLKFFAKNYEGSTVWTHLGLCYMDVVSKTDKELFRYYISQYKQLIEKHKNFLEVFDNESPYKTPFYYSDGGMLWCSKYLWLKCMNS